MAELNNCGVLMNGKPLSWYGGAALVDYSIGETPLTVDAFQGVNRTSWRLLKSIFGRRTIKITVVFSGPSLKAAKLQRSKFNGDIFGKTELFISGDGFFYDCVCQNLGPEVRIGEGDRDAKIKADYTFVGVRREALETLSVASGATFYCRSTMPFTDCKLTATVGSTGTNYALGGATFASVTAGDVLVFDGINGKITKNGVNAAASVSWTDFPQLTPGSNTVTCADAVTVEYFPTFI